MTGAFVWIGAIVAVVAALWAGLLALGEEAAVGDAMHTLGDAPPIAGGRRVPLHRALYITRLALLVLAAVAAADALSWWTRSPGALWLALGIETVFLFVLGDALPRSVARLAPELVDVALPLSRRTLAPFGFLLAFLGWMDRALHGMVATPRPLEPALGRAQRDMLLGVFTLADTTVDEVMTPRLDMDAVDLSASLPDVLAAFRTSDHTRLPVIDGTPDTVLGIVFAKDFVPVVHGAAGAEPPARWQDLIRPAAVVPETKTLDAQLRDFQRGAAHIALVVDEFGGTAGIITLEDILEEIVGELHDVGDGEQPTIERDGDRFWVHGRVGLDQLSEALGVPFTSSEVSTVGGLIYSALGRVPRSGEELSLDGFRVVVERVERRRVTRVYFERR
jgi:CBS domain containing-hemolysin-like protein